MLIFNSCYFRSVVRKFKLINMGLEDDKIAQWIAQINEGSNNKDIIKEIKEFIEASKIKSYVSQLFVQELYNNLIVLKGNSKLSYRILEYCWSNCDYGNSKVLHFYLACTYNYFCHCIKQPVRIMI